MASIAIIGAGLSGLVTANALAPDHSVVVFDKSRGSGGRMATRYADPYEFDHGAQFFTARTDAFAAVCRQWSDDGVIAVWDAEFRDFRGPEIVAERRWDSDFPHYVGTPRMNTIGKWLARSLDVRLNTEIAALRRQGTRWTLLNGNGESVGEFDWLVLALPAPQAAALVPEEQAFVDRCADTEMRACYAMMLGFAGDLPIKWQAAHVQAADISWMSVNSSKPGRSDKPCMVVHSTNAWANANLETSIEDVRRHLLAELHRVSGMDPTAADYVSVHRWRYANVPLQTGDPCYVDAERGLGACGDWFIRGRIEAAFTSAQAHVERLSVSL